MTPAEHKARLRREVRTTVAALSVQERAEASARLVDRISTWPVFLQARTVLLTASLADEVDLTPLIGRAQALGKRCALPFFNSANQEYGVREWNRPVAELIPGAYGVREPGESCGNVPFPDLDFILVPGVAFTSSGMRLGRGKGYFDRLLQRAASAVTCGIGFDCQMVPSIPSEAHDVAMDFVLTPACLFDCRSPG
jgi:5-formyltetrahydrofolate cyclo-ligase